VANELVIWLLMGLASAAEPPCREPALMVDRALLQARNMDPAGAESALKEAELAFACSGPAAPALLARFWVIEGIIGVFKNDEAWKDDFGAAARVAPDVWIDDFGRDMREKYDSVRGLPVDAGTLDVSAPLGAGWALWIDGQPATVPLSLPAGLHLLQIGFPEGESRFARMVYVPGGGSLAVEHELTGPAPKAAVVIQGDLHVAIGADAGFGPRTEVLKGGEPLVESMAKPVLPLELGYRMAIGKAWVRLHGDVAPLVVGKFVYRGDPEPQTTIWSFGGYLSGGVDLGAFAFGGMAGLSVPGRVKTRATASVDLGKSGFVLEARAGVNFLTDRTPEFGAGLSLGYPIRLFRTKPTRK
jgi:hypothetical protein